jgi:hypothetical protein
MLTIVVALLVCVIGGIVHLLSPRFATLGAWAFGVGLWWTLAEVAHHVIRLG